MGKPAQGPPFAATRRALAEALAEIDGLLPGSVVVRLMRCGKRNCACKADPPILHGPTPSGLAPSGARPSPSSSPTSSSPATNHGSTTADGSKTSSPSSRSCPYKRSRPPIS